MPIRSLPCGLQLAGLRGFMGLPRATGKNPRLRKCKLVQFGRDTRCVERDFVVRRLNTSLETLNPEPLRVHPYRFRKEALAKHPRPEGRGAQACQKRASALQKG